MNFEFINSLRLLLLENNVFQFVITGGKTLALVLLTFKFLDGVIGSMGDENQKLSNLPKFIAYAFFIVASDWIINLIESSFAVIDVTMQATDSNLYSVLNDSLATQFETITKGAKSWIDYIGIFFSCFEFIIFYAIALILMAFCKIADLSMTCGYLLSRIFLIELMKIVFPIIIALSTLDMTKDLLAKWIKRYIGLFVLGLGYIGIIHFTELVQNAIMQQFTTNAGEVLDFANALSDFSFGMIITIIVVFTLKVKLFAQVTSFISNLFA